MKASTRLQTTHHQVPSALRRTGIALTILMTMYCFCGASSPQGCSSSNQSFNVGPSKGEVTAAVVGTLAVVAVGTVVLVELHKSHHTLKGCVEVGPHGLQVTTSGAKPRTYLLDGPTANVRMGDLVRFQGDRVKLTTDDAGDRTFQIKKIGKDYGPCQAVAKPNG